MFAELNTTGTSLAVQWLRCCTSSVADVGLIPGWGTKIPHAAQRGQKQKQRQTNKQKPTENMSGSKYTKILSVVLLFI